MDAFMNITVNVRSTSAERQIRAVAREVEYVRRAMDRARLAGARFGALSSGNLERYAKNLQWVGRQIEFNFTLPLVLGGAAVTKWALENERAMVRVRKVYNESAGTAGGLDEELTALSKSFRLLSDYFGVHQNEVIEIGAAWAQAGANGRALAEATRQTLEVMILGEMEAADATSALIAIQQQYALSTEELALVMGQLNAIENETAVSFQGLVTAMSRGAGAARAAGVDWREFAAMTAALVPAAGGAAEAGNALRTMISRIMAPTRESRDLMAELGLEVNETAWNSSNFVERLHLLRQEMDGVTTSQQNQIAATVASRWQVNRFNVLLNDLTDSQSRYQRSLDVTADSQEVMNRYQDELRTYLTSTPQGFSILTTQIRNLLTQGIQPLLPFFLQVLTVLRDAVRWFVELPAPVQKTVAVLTGLLVIFGPLLRIIGAFGLVFVRTGRMLFWLEIPIKFAMKALMLFGGGVGAVASSIGTVLIGALLGLGKILLWVLNPFGVFTKAFSGMTAFMVAKWKAMNLALLGWAKATWAALPGMMRAAAAATSAALYALDTAFLAWASRMRVAIPAALYALDTAFLAWARGLRTVIPAALAALDAAFFAWIGRVRVMIATLPLIFGAVMTKVGLIIKAVPAMLYALDTAFLAWLSRVGAVMRALPLLVGAAITRVGFFFKSIPWMLAALDAAFLSWLSRVGVVMRGLPVIMGAAMAKAGAVMRAGWAAIVAITQVGATLMQLAFAVSWRRLPMMALAGMKNLIRVIAGGFASIRLLAGFAGKGMIAFLAPYLAVLAAAIAAIFIFRDQIRDAIHFVLTDWRRIPEVVGNALVATVRIIRDAAIAAYEWLSYFNPFVRHSPSLVESVKAGIAIIAAEYSKLSNLDHIFNRSINVLENFRRATEAAAEAMREAEFAESLEAILSVSPGAAGPINAMLRSIDELKSQLPILQSEYNAQAVVVARWKTELDNANAALEEQQSILDSLTATANGLQDELSAANERLSDLANTPIEGMGAMSDAIFENEMAQKRLRLEILRLEEAGDAVDDVRNRMSALSGEIEMLRGTREELRLAGAGSDVLGFYDQQINNLEAERRALMDAAASGGAATEIDALRAELEELQREGEILDLENSLQFDPLTRQIDEVVNGMREMPFDEIISKIKEEKSNVADLTARWEEAKAAVEAQQDVVGVFTARRDELQQTYDAEVARLNELEQAYNAIEAQIREMESALKDFTAQAEKAARAAAAGASGGDVSSSVEDFRNSVGDFEIPGGSGADLTGGDIEAFNAEMEAMLEGLFPSLDIFGKFREWWDRAFEYGRTAWENLLSFFSGTDTSVIGNWIDKAFDVGKTLVQKFGLQQLATNIYDTIENIKDIFSTLGKWLSGPFLGFWRMVRDFVLDVVDAVWEELNNWVTELGPLFKDAWSNVVAIIEGIVKVIGGIIAGVVWVIYMAWEPLSRILKPIFDAVVGVIRAALQFIRGLIHFVLAIIGGEWDEVWRGFVTMLDAAWDAIFAVLKGAIGIVWGIIKSIIDVIVAPFKWLWNWLVGNSLIPDLVNAIVGWWKRLKNWTADIFNKVRDFLKNIWNWINRNVFQPIWNTVDRFVVQPFKRAKDGVVSAWNTMRDRVRDAWNWLKANVIIPIARFLVERVVLPVLNMKDRVIDGWRRVYEGVRTIVTNIRTWLGDKINSIKDFVIEKFDLIKDRVIGIWESIGSTISNIADGIWGSMKRAINFMIDGVNAMIRMWNGIEFGLPEIPSWVPGVGGKGGGTIGTPNIGYIPRLESGGVFDSPTLALIAESQRARPEIVTPESLMRQVFRTELESLQGGNREIHFHGDLSFPNINSGEDAEDFISNLENMAG